MEQDEIRAIVRSDRWARGGELDEISQAVWLAYLASGAPDFKTPEKARKWVLSQERLLRQRQRRLAYRHPPNTDRVAESAVPSGAEQRVRLRQFQQIARSKGKSKLFEMMAAGMSAAEIARQTKRPPHQIRKDVRELRTAFRSAEEDEGGGGILFLREPVRRKPLTGHDFRHRATVRGTAKMILTLDANPDGDVVAHLCAHAAGLLMVARRAGDLFEVLRYAPLEQLVLGEAAYVELAEIVPADTIEVFGIRLEKPTHRVLDSAEAAEIYVQEILAEVVESSLELGWTSLWYERLLDGAIGVSRRPVVSMQPVDVRKTRDAPLTKATPPIKAVLDAAQEAGRAGNLQQAAELYRQGHEMAVARADAEGQVFAGQGLWLVSKHLGFAEWGTWALKRSLTAGLDQKWHDRLATQQAYVAWTKGALDDMERWLAICIDSDGLKYRLQSALYAAGRGEVALAEQLVDGVLADPAHLETFREYQLTVLQEALLLARLRGGITEPVQRKTATNPIDGKARAHLWPKLFVRTQREKQTLSWAVVVRVCVELLRTRRADDGLMATPYRRMLLWLIVEALGEQDDQALDEAPDAAGKLFRLMWLHSSQLDAELPLYGGACFDGKLVLMRGSALEALPGELADDVAAQIREALCMTYTTGDSPLWAVIGRWLFPQPVVGRAAVVSDGWLEGISPMALHAAAHPDVPVPELVVLSRHRRSLDWQTAVGTEIISMADPEPFDGRSPKGAIYTLPAAASEVREEEGVLYRGAEVTTAALMQLSQCHPEAGLLVLGVHTELAEGEPVLALRMADGQLRATDLGGADLPPIVALSGCSTAPGWACAGEELSKVHGLLSRSRCVLVFGGPVDDEDAAMVMRSILDRWRVLPAPTLADFPKAVAAFVQHAHAAGTLSTAARLIQVRM